MSVQTPGSSGATQNTSGVSDNQSNNSNPQAPVEQEKAPDTVHYETYKKVLNEKKRKDEENLALSEKVKAFERAEKERQEKQLLDEKNFQKMLEIRDKELQDERTKRETMERTLTDGMKKDAFLKAINGRIDEAYSALIDLSKIAIDPVSGLPDLKTVQEAAKEFETRYSRVIERGNGARVPNEAPQGGTGTITLEQWKALPLKEKKERLKDVISQNSWEK